MVFATIFDLDGTLVDTHRIFWTAQNNLLGPYGITFTPEDIKEYSGKSLAENIQKWNEKFNISLNEEEYRKSYIEEQIKLMKSEKPDSSLVKLLEELEDYGVPKGIGTSSGRKRAKKILKCSGLRRYFPILVAEEDVHNHKPSPDVFLKVADLLNVPPERCIVFEDSYNGALAGRIAKMKVVGYLNKHNSPKDLIEAHTLIKSYSDVNYHTLLKMLE